MELRRTARSLAIAAATTGVVGLHVGAVTFFSTRNPYSMQLFPPCPILALTGWQCPGCGGTRAAYSLLHGDVIASLAMNPLLLTIYVALALVGLGAVLRTRAPRFAAALQYSAPALLVGATLYSAVLRNLLPD